MTETDDQYKARLATYGEGKDPIAMQRETPRRLAQLIVGVAEARISVRPAPGKWSVTEILAHLAEDELTSTWRYRQMLEHERPELRGFDQDLMLARLHARAVATPRHPRGTRPADRAGTVPPHGSPRHESHRPGANDPGPLIRYTSGLDFFFPLVVFPLPFPISQVHP